MYMVHILELWNIFIYHIRPTGFQYTIKILYLCIQMDLTPNLKTQKLDICD